MASVQPDLAESARELVAYELGDYELNTYSTSSVDQYRAFMRSIVTEPVARLAPIRSSSEDSDHAQ